MNRKSYMKRIVIGVISLTSVMATGCSSAKGDIRFGAAGVGGMYSAFGNAFTQMTSEDHEELDFTVKTTAGSSANLRLLSEGYIQLAIAQADLTEDAYNGQGEYEKNPLQGYRAVAALYTEACQIVVREDSEIDSVDDLMDCKVSVGEEESGTEKNAEEILDIYGLTDKLVEKENYNYTEAAEALENGEIDAMFCTAGTQTTVLEELAKKCDIKFISLDEEHIEKLEKAYESYLPYTIEADTYTGQTQEVSTVGVKCLLLASENLDADTVQELTSSLFNHANDIEYALPMNLSLNETEATKNVSIPFHEGAYAYYAEQGIEVDKE